MCRAVLDATSTYRYRLSRCWLGGAGGVLFIILNPSTADARQDDPTIRRCIRFAQRWGAARLEVVNLFAYRATSPGGLIDVHDPIGPENNYHILTAANLSGRIVVAWGVLGTFLDRDKAVLKMLGDRPLFCLGRTKGGHPRHPLYVPYAQPLEPYP